MLWSINNNEMLSHVVNARSVYNKLNELEILVDKNSRNTVCITETCLIDNIPNEEINCLGMHCINQRQNSMHGS